MPETIPNYAPMPGSLGGGTALAPFCGRAAQKQTAPALPTSCQKAAPSCLQPSTIRAKPAGRECKAGRALLRRHAPPVTMGVEADDARMSDIVQGLLETGQPHGALVAARSIIDLDPHSADAWADMGDVLRELGRFSEAVTAYERSLESGAPPFGVLVGKAEAHAELGQYEAATGCYAEAHEIDPQDKDVMVGWAYCLLETARSRREDGAARDGIDGAAALAERAMTPVEPNIEHPFEILEILTLAGRHGDARDLSGEILENDPADAETRAYRSDNLCALGLLDDALEDAEEATRLDPYNAHAWLARGSACVRQEMYPDALESFKRALAIDARDDRCWLGRAEALAGMGRGREAADSLLVAVSLDPKNVRELDRPLWSNQRGDILRRMPA